ncbi:MULTISPECIES: ABC transporter transmembrane domain-containing protein [unclassified Methylibium]|uniref:ABC transporter transmembrane domain-containing protein n=1 Tax=unclassified Methylibium TaxID=2633235 RepID=UPI0003F3D030|nr:MULTISPECIES: ABC transporter transmembrane domain-containing protein [unclassified Methylibium]EWS55167.1 putative multidrug export ATP-binding/permease protein [Methylibium sp. T29]EWS59522.1 putative multidrug export ATP-binding/permease protein [Methylibium sp. T29-B]
MSQAVTGGAAAGAGAKARSVRPLRGLLPFLKPYRGRIVLAGLFLVGAALTTLVFPVALKALIDQGLVSSDPGKRVLALRGHFFALFGVGAALGVFSALRFYMVTWLGERITADLRNAVYAHVVKQSPQFFETTQTGEVLSRLTTDTTLVQTVVGSSLSMGLRNTVMGLGALVMLVITNPVVMAQVLGILVLVVLPALWFGRKVRSLSRASQDRVADSSAIAAEVLNAVPVVQSYTQEAREAQRFDASTARAFATAVRRTRMRAGLVAFIITATFGALLWGLYQGTQAVIRGEISAGHLGQTVVYVILLVSSVAVLAEVWGDLLRAAGASERLMELLATRSPIESPARPRALAAAPIGSRVSLRDVVFRYPSRPLTPALDGVTIDVEPGQTVALVGPSGAGKSTVFQLLLRYYDTQGGTVAIDGVPVREADLGALRSRIGLVPQDSVIFSTSAMENIRYGRPEASDDEVIAAARAAHADTFIRALPEGYASFLGERGVRLSGGQRQRISIARAILKNAPLLLLDEATSALDSESERAVQAALDEAMRGRTTLVIAHRLGTVMHADRIVVLDAGRVVDSGTHTELLARSGLYQRLAASQFSDAPAMTVNDA